MIILIEYKSDENMGVSGELRLLPDHLQNYKTLSGSVKEINVLVIQYHTYISQGMMMRSIQFRGKRERAHGQSQKTR